MKIGKRINQIRTDQRLSLEELAKRSGVSRSMLSEIERDTKSPTLRTLSQLAVGLGVSIAELLGESSDQFISVDRKADRSVGEGAGTGMKYEALAPGWRSEGLGIILITLPRGQSTGALARHPLNTREHIYVISGNVTVRIDDEEHALGAGDAVSFLAAVSHELIAGDSDCQLLVTVKGPRPELVTVSTDT